MNSPRRVDLALATAAFLLGIAVAGVAWTLPASREDGDIGPAGFPLLVAAALVGLGATRLIRGWRSEQETGPMIRLLPVVAMLAAGSIAGGLMPLVGFIPASILLLGTGALIAGERRPVRLILFAIVLSLACYALFAFVFAVRLPHGLLEGILG